VPLYVSLRMTCLGGVDVGFFALLLCSPCLRYLRVTHAQSATRQVGRMLTMVSLFSLTSHDELFLSLSATVAVRNVYDKIPRRF
jgi:hypothetical protein